MKLRLRTRFALATGLCVLVVASLVGVVGYLAARSSLLDRASRTAQTEARHLVSLIDQPRARADSQGNVVDITDPSLTHGLAAPGSVIEVRRPGGALIQAGAPTREAPPRLPRGLNARCLAAGKATARADTPPLALGCQRIGPAGRSTGTVVVGVPLGDILASLATLRLALLLGVLGGAGLAAGLALLLARRALAPIRQIAATAKAIRSGGLGERVGYQGHDELGALAAELDACFDELEQVLNRQRRFGADASHELRTPLAAIRANAELLRRRGSEDRELRERAVASLEQASARAARLIEDLLYLATIEREPATAHLPTRLDEVVLGVVREAAPLRQDVEIEVSDLREATVGGDAQRLQQLLLNVLDNALRVSPAGGKVFVSLDIDADQARVTVSDQGPGIEAAELGRIFDRLYSREREPGARSGSGLGLSIARAIARSHGGELSAESEPGRGATFTLSLPVQASLREAVRV